MLKAPALQNQNRKLSRSSNRLSRVSMQVSNPCLCRNINIFNTVNTELNVLTFEYVLWKNNLRAAVRQFLFVAVKIDEPKH
jgi:hypothetical protein